MLWPALDDPDPVLIFEHASLYNTEGELGGEPAPVDISTAALRRPGRDVTLIAYGGTLRQGARRRRELLAGEGHRRRGDRPAVAAAARRRADVDRAGAPDAPRGRSSTRAGAAAASRPR